MKRRTLSLLLALTMIICLFGGCNSGTAEPSASPTQSAETSAPPAETPSEAPPDAPPDAPPEESPDEPPEDIPEEPPEPERKYITYPIGDKTKKITFFTDFGFFDMGLDSYNNHPRLQEIIDATGVIYEFKEVSFTVKSEQFNLMIVSGEMTDVIQCGQYYMGGEGAAYTEEIIYDLTDLLPEYAPDYWEAFMNTNEATIKSHYTEGHLLSMRTIKNQYIDDMGAITRGDWLKELNMDAPTTFQEFNDMLYAFKDAYNCEYTYVCNPDSVIQYMQAHFQTNLFQIGGTAIPTQRNDTEIVGSMTSDNYREYLEWFRQLYVDGIIYKDYYTAQMSEATYFAQVGRNNAGVWQNTSGSFEAMVPYLGDNVSVEAAALPRTVGDNGLYDFAAEPVLISEAYNISVSCEDPSLVIMFYNWFFTDEGSLLANWGREGVSFEYGADGKPFWTDAIIGESAGTWAMWINTWKLGPSLTDATVSFASYNENQHAAIDLWNDDSILSSDHSIPTSAGLNSAEVTENASIVTDITTYASETLLRFITGELELNDANWEVYVNQCVTLGHDKYIAACQNAYDEYVAGVR